MDKLDLDNPEITIERIKVIENKPALKYLYQSFYKTFIVNSNKLPIGKKIELGSGAGFLKKIIPDVITSDVMKLPNCDIVVSAEKIPYKNSSLSAIYMLNVFHHIKDPTKALSEFSRCLKTGGKVIMIEPFNSLWGRFVYQNFHHETFDPNGDWKIKDKGDLSSANGALPWIIFSRDKDKFAKLFPKLKIEKLEPHTPFCYLFSGGFTSPQLIPLTLFRYLTKIESHLTPLNKYLGMFATIVLKRV